MKEQSTKVKNDADQEDLTLYPISEEQEQTQAVVSIGHIDFRATFCFANNEDALACYKALQSIVEMNIN